MYHTLGIKRDDEIMSPRHFDMDTQTFLSFNVTRVFNERQPLISPVVSQMAKLTLRLATWPAVATLLLLSRVFSTEVER